MGEGRFLNMKGMKRVASVQTYQNEKLKANQPGEEWMGGIKVVKEEEKNARVIQIRSQS